jgi:hypothetical protein
MTFGYNANVVQRGSTARVTIRGISSRLIALLNLEREDPGQDHIPIIFVAHSLGGLICKRAIQIAFADDDPKVKSISSSWLGTIFMGTPHTGSVVADIFKPLASAVNMVWATGNFLKDLKKDKTTVAELDSEFMTAIRRISTDINIFCFYEGQCMPGLRILIVNMASATYPQYKSQVINADHSKMVKFTSRNDPSFRLFCSTVREFLESKRAENFPSLLLVPQPPAHRLAEPQPLRIEAPPASNPFATDSSGNNSHSQSPFGVGPSTTSGSHSNSYTYFQ